MDDWNYNIPCYYSNSNTPSSPIINESKMNNESHLIDLLIENMRNTTDSTNQIQNTYQEGFFNNALCYNNFNSLKLDNKGFNSNINNQLIFELSKCNAYERISNLHSQNHTSHPDVKENR